MAQIVIDPAWKPYLLTRIEGVLETVATAVQADAEAACPVDTGALKASIDHEVIGLEARVTADTPYAAYVEEGHRIVAWGHDTGRMQPPQPYLKPALYRERIL